MRLVIAVAHEQENGVWPRASVRVYPEIRSNAALTYSKRLGIGDLDHVAGVLDRGREQVLSFAPLCWVMSSETVTTPVIRAGRLPSGTLVVSQVGMPCRRSLSSRSASAE